MEHRDPGEPKQRRPDPTGEIGRGPDPAVERDEPRRDDASSRPRGSAGRGDGRPPDDARRRRGGPDRRQAGFGDGIERAFCALFRAPPPAGFPVQHRLGIATMRPAIVARRPEALLLCDSSHAGDHLWPNHEPVDDAEWSDESNAAAPTP